MQTERDDVPRARLNVSAAWSSDLSPIHSLASNSPALSTMRRQHALHSSYPLETRGHTGGTTERRRSQPPGSHTGARSFAFPYPHLVRSRSPPEHLSSSPFASPQLDTDAEATLLRRGTIPAHSRVEDTFEDLLAREWPFHPFPSDSQDVAEAVRCGQESALMHYANGGFKDVSSRLAQEAGTISMEANRYRLAAQESTMRCKAAVKVCNQTRAELAAAQQQLQVLMDTAAPADQKQEKAPKDNEHATPPTPFEASIEALTIQLDQELTKMRAQKERYELLCRQKAHLDVQVEDWRAKEKKLEAKLERELNRRRKELEETMNQTRGRPSPFPMARAHGDQQARMDAWLREFDVCIMERRELLRHLQGGFADRFEQFKTLLSRTHKHGFPLINRRQVPRQDVPPTQLSALSEAENRIAKDRHDERSPLDDVDAASSSTADTSLGLLDYLSKVHLAVSLGEEEALTEMEHLRVLLHRLQLQENRKRGLDDEGHTTRLGTVKGGARQENWKGGGDRGNLTTASAHSNERDLA